MKRKRSRKHQQSRRYNNVNNFQIKNKVGSMIKYVNKVQVEEGFEEFKVYK